MILIYEPIINQLCFLTLFINALICCSKVLFNKIQHISIYSEISMNLSSLFLILVLVERWFISGHIPLSNLYESCIFLACSLSLLYQTLAKSMENDSIGIIVASINLLLQGFATFSLPVSMQQATLLVPALQSNWLMMHVSMMILSYGLLIIGSILSISFLVINSKLNRLESSIVNLSLNIQDNSEKIQYFLEEYYFVNYKKLLINQLDYWSYRLISIGFPFLTIGILSGAVWANEAWGSYWSWDPKETWAMVTWIIFAIYLHMRIFKNSTEKESALIASIGLFVVWSCYLGVNLLGKGLHSYGWLTQ